MKTNISACLHLFSDSCGQKLITNLEVQELGFYMQNFYSRFCFASEVDSMSCAIRILMSHIWFTWTKWRTIHLSTHPSGPVLKQTSVPPFFPCLQASDCLRGFCAAFGAFTESPRNGSSLPQDQATAVHHFHPPTMQSKPQGTFCFCKIILLAFTSIWDWQRWFVLACLSTHFWEQHLPNA